MHHGPEDEGLSEHLREQLREVFRDDQPDSAENALKPQLGPTGRFPGGKLVDSDEGEIRLAVGTKGGKVVLDLGAPTAWVGFDPEQARDLAQLFVKHAEIAEIPTEETTND